jgi:hypothetical protein
MTSPAVARESASAYQWHVAPSGACIGTDPVVLAELSEFRGRILYANGRRPAVQICVYGLPLSNSSNRLGNFSKAEVAFLPSVKGIRTGDVFEHY